LGTKPATHEPLGDISYSPQQIHKEFYFLREKLARTGLASKPEKGYIVRSDLKCAGSTHFSSASLGSDFQTYLVSRDRAVMQETNHQPDYNSQESKQAVLSCGTGFLKIILLVHLVKGLSILFIFSDLIFIISFCLLVGVWFILVFLGA
jgi:hypothetical protein